MRALVLAAALSALAPISAQATFPGQNGKILYGGTGGWTTVNPDGTGKAFLPVGGDSAWSADGQKIAFSFFTGPTLDIRVMNADGTNQQPVTSGVGNDRQPAWSSSGAQIAFTATQRPNETTSCSDLDSEVFITDLAGNVTQITTAVGDESQPDWSPHGGRIAFGFSEWTILQEDPFCEVFRQPSDIYTIDPDGTDAMSLTDVAGLVGTTPSWSPDGQRLVFWGGRAGVSGSHGIWVMNADGSGAVQLTSNVNDGYPSWSPDGQRIVFSKPGGSSHTLWTMDPDGGNQQQIVNDFSVSTSWQPLSVETLDPHARPRGATPFRVPLVPAYNSCTSPNRQHGPPLAFGSCNPPVPGTSRLTIGVGDGSPAFARGEGRLRMDVVIGAPGPPDDSDVNLTFRVTNVMRASDLSEYTGELRTELTVRRTDRDPPGAAPHSTSMDFPFGFTVPCTPTPSSSLDASTCTSFTSANAIVPLAIEDTHRAIWALDKVRVYDGGPDEDADTDAGRSLFMTQGVFVP